MKIEVELAEVESLRSQLQQKEMEVNELEIKLKELSEPELKQKAVRLSYRLFDNYMAAVFKHLGFGEWQRDSVIIREDLEHWLGKDWWDSDRITVELGANVTTKFKSAFLSIGILSKKEDDKKSDDAYDLV